MIFKFFYFFLFYLIKLSYFSSQINQHIFSSVKLKKPKIPQPSIIKRAKTHVNTHERYRSVRSRYSATHGNEYYRLLGAKPFRRPYPTGIFRRSTGYRTAPNTRYSFNRSRDSFGGRGRERRRVIDPPISRSLRTNIAYSEQYHL